jgi:hypothetical protein
VRGYFACSSGDEPKAILNGRLEVEIYFVAHFKGTVSVCFDHREVNKSIVPGRQIIGGDGTPPFVRFEEFHRAECHGAIMRPLQAVAP